MAAEAGPRLPPGREARLVHPAGEEVAHGRRERRRSLERREVPGARDDHQLRVGQARDEDLGEGQAGSGRPRSPRSRGPGRPSPAGRRGGRRGRRGPPGPARCPPAAARRRWPARRRGSRRRPGRPGAARSRRGRAGGPLRADRAAAGVAPLPGLGRVRLGAGVGQDQAGDPLGMARRQRERRVAAEGEPADGRPPGGRLGGDAPATASAKPSTLGDSSGGACPRPGKSGAITVRPAPRAPPPPAPRSGRPGGTDGAARWGVGSAIGPTVTARRDAKCAGTLPCARGHSTPVATAGPERRRQASLGGLVPSAAVAREGDTLVWRSASSSTPRARCFPCWCCRTPRACSAGTRSTGLAVRDDAGRGYEVASLAQQAGLGALQTAVWIEPAPPPDARRLQLRSAGWCARRSRRRRGRRAPAGRGDLGADIDLVPARTGRRRSPTSRPAAPAPGRPARVPARTFGGLPRSWCRSARRGWTRAAAVCLWALERYAERVGAQRGHPGRGAAARGPADARAPGGSTSGTTAARATRWRRSTASRGPGWSEASLELVPADRPEAAGARGALVDLPGGAGRPAAASARRALRLRRRAPAAAVSRARAGAVVGRPPDLRRGRERGADARGRARASSTRRGLTAACWWSTTARPTAPPTWPRPWPAATRGWPCCAARPRRASGRPTAPVSGARSPRARGWWWRWTATSRHDPARLPDLVAAAADADLVLGSRYVPGGGVARWGPLRRAISRGGLLVRPAGARRAGARPDRRLQVLPPRGARGDPARPGRRPPATASRSR